MENIQVSSEKEGILLLTFVGEINDTTDINVLRSDVNTVSTAIKNLHKEQSKKIKVLIDIVSFKAQYVSEAVDVLVELARGDKELVEKTAVFGVSDKVRIIGETIVVLPGRTNIKFFETKPEAIAWLAS